MVMGQTILETERLLLREMTCSDMGALREILQDPRVMYAYNGPFDEQECAVWLQKQLRRYEEFGFGLWAVLLKETGRMIGQCGITMQEYKGKMVPEVGYLFAYSFWHQGYATEAARACREYGVKTLGFPVIYSIIRDTNEASQKVAIRNGMHPIDTLVKHYRGVEIPHIVYAVESELEPGNKG